MLSHLQLLADFNLWADECFNKLINQLDPSFLDKSSISSFPSIRKTIGHIYDADKIWLSRLGGTDLKNWPSSSLELFEIELLIEVSKDLKAYVGQLNEQEINKICTYEDREGNTFEQSFEEILLHVFNHATYHRGQLISMLRQLGVIELPPTDIIYYLRERP